MSKIEEARYQVVNYKPSDGSDPHLIHDKHARVGGPKDPSNCLASTDNLEHAQRIVNALNLSQHAERLAEALKQYAEYDDDWVKFDQGGHAAAVLAAYHELKKEIGE